MSNHNIGFYEDLTKIIFELSSNTHLISSAVCVLHNLKQHILSVRGRAITNVNLWPDPIAHMYLYN